MIFGALATGTGIHRFGKLSPLIVKSLKTEAARLTTGIRLTVGGLHLMPILFLSFSFYVSLPFRVGVGMQVL
jgi:hypothetical protein